MNKERIEKLVPLIRLMNHALIYQCTDQSTVFLANYFYGSIALMHALIYQFIYIRTYNSIIINLISFTMHSLFNLISL